MNRKIKFSAGSLTQRDSWEESKITAENVADLFKDVEYDPNSYIQFTLRELRELLSKERAEGERRVLDLVKQAAKEEMVHASECRNIPVIPASRFMDRLATLPADSTEDTTNLTT